VKHGQKPALGACEGAARRPHIWYRTAPTVVLGHAYLAANLPGKWCNLYLIPDAFSRKIVVFEVHDTDDSLHVTNLVNRTALAEGTHALTLKPVLHGDNG
jgi:putative transposase